MKKILIPFLTILLMSFGKADTSLSKAERSVAAKDMCKTRSRVVKAVKGLSEKQLNFKSSPNAWSIAECVEHLALSEQNFFGLIQKTLQTPADPSRRSEVKMADKDILKLVTDRSNKVKTTEAFEPSGKFGSHKATLKAFKKKRKETIRFIKKTDADLRNRYTDFPFGLADTYQVFLVLSAHTERHVQQMEEIMSRKDFPSK